MEEKPLVDEIQNYAQNIVDTVREAQLLAAIGEGRSELLDYGVATLAESIAKWRGPEKPQDDISILAVEFSVAAEVVRLGAQSLMGPPVTTLSCAN